MRQTTAAIVQLVALAAPASGFAATASATFTDGATVQASCSLPVRSLLSQPLVAIHSSFSVCAPAATPAAIIARAAERDPGPR